MNQKMKLRFKQRVLCATLTAALVAGTLVTSAAPAMADEGTGSSQALAGSSVVQTVVGQPNPDFYKALDLSSGMNPIDHLAAFNILIFRLVMFPIGQIFGLIDSTRLQLSS